MYTLKYGGMLLCACPPPVFWLVAVAELLVAVVFPVLGLPYQLSFEFIVATLYVLPVGTVCSAILLEYVLICVTNDLPLSDG